MMGGLISAALANFAKWPLPAAVLAAVVCVVVAAILLDRVALQYAKRKTVLTYAMITIGASIFLRGLMQIVVGRGVEFLPAFGVLPGIKLGGVFISSQYVWILVVTVVVGGVLSWLFLRTRIGKAMRAASQNVRSAALCGIEPTRMSMLAFALAGGTGALAGALIAPIGASFYEYGLHFALKGFAAAVLGGFGSPVGAVIGGILLGLGESLCAGYISSAYKDAVSLLVLLAVLLVWPSGLVGQAEARRV
jgi:branched-chain amino acid transport system permease protein